MPQDRVSKQTLRESWELLGDNYNYYFGQTKRQAVLSARGQTYYGESSLIDLEYRDERLYELATQQQEKRKAAAKINTENNLKGNL
jgi:hypothetical protein